LTPPEGQSAAAAAAERVRAVLEAAEQSAADLRAEAAQEVEGQLARAQAVAERLSGRADEIEKALQKLADSVRDELSALKADLEELRAVKEGIGASQEEPPPAAVEQPAEPAPAEPEPEEPAPAEAAPVEAAPVEAAPADAGAAAGAEGARVIALNMALNGSSREDTARYLAENFGIDDPKSLLDEVYARVGG
jgi:ABC-type transporter Mla subunit MlaD